MELKDYVRAQYGPASQRAGFSPSPIRPRAEGPLAQQARLNAKGKKKRGKGEDHFDPTDPDSIMYRVFRKQWRTMGYPKEAAMENMRDAAKNRNTFYMNKYMAWLHKYEGGHYRSRSPPPLPSRPEEITQFSDEDETVAETSSAASGSVMRRGKWHPKQRRNSAFFSPMTPGKPAPNPNIQQSSPSPSMMVIPPVSARTHARNEDRHARRVLLGNDTTWDESSMHVGGESSTAFDTDDTVQEHPGQVGSGNYTGMNESTIVEGGGDASGGGAPQQVQEEGLEEAEDAGVQRPARVPGVGEAEMKDHKKFAAQMNEERKAAYDERAANPTGAPDLNARLQVPRDIRRATDLPQTTSTYHGPYDRGTLQPYVNLAEMGYQGVGGLHVYTGMTAAQVNRTNAKRKRQGYILYDDVTKTWTHIKKKDIPTTKSSEMSAVISQAIKKRKISADAGGPITGWEHRMREENDTTRQNITMDHASTRQPGNL